MLACACQLSQGYQWLFGYDTAVKLCEYKKWLNLEAISQSAMVTRLLVGGGHFDCVMCLRCLL